MTSDMNIYIKLMWTNQGNIFLSSTMLGKNFLSHYQPAWTQWDVPPPLCLSPGRSWTAERHLSFVSGNNGTVI